MRPRLNKDLGIIYLVSALCSVVLIAIFGVCEIYDSSSYIRAWDALSEGRLDALRTPVYPLFLHGLYVVFGPGSFLFAAICVQHLVFLLSLRLLYSLLGQCRLSPGSVFWMTLIYGCLPAITSWNNCILTESLALSGTIALLYLVFRTDEHPTVAHAASVTCILLFLLLLRPIFIYLIPVLLFYSLLLLFRPRTKKKGGWLLGGGVLLSAICFLLYMNEYKKEYGIFSTSNVSVINQYFIARQSGLIDPESIRDARLKSDIELYFQIHGGKDEEPSFLWEEAQDIAANHNLLVIQENLKTAMGHNLMNSIRSVKDRFMDSAQKPLLFSPIWKISILFLAWGFSLSTLYLCLLLFPIYLVLWVIRKREIPWKSLLLYLLGISNILVAVLGAQGEWNRLIFPSMPIWFLLGGQVFRLRKQLV